MSGQGAVVGKSWVGRIGIPGAPFRGFVGVLIRIFAALYVASAAMSFFLYEANDLGEASEPASVGAATGA